MSTLKANPYQDLEGTWWWSDENDFAYGPFPTQHSALRNILEYMDDMHPEHPKPWHKLWWRFW